MKLRLRADKPPGGPPAPIESPDPASPEARLPARPAAAEPSGTPAVPGESTAVGATLATPPLVRLKPRISIKPSEPERTGETIPDLGLPSVLPPIGSGALGLPGMTEEKVKIDLAPLIRPPEAGSPAGAVSPAMPLGGEKTEAAIKFKLKPASAGVPESTALPGLAEVKRTEVTMIRPATANPAIAEVMGSGTIPTLASTLKTTEVSTPQKPGRRASLVVLVGLLVVCCACYLWFFGRAPKRAAVAHPPTVEAKPLPPASGVAAVAHPPTVEAKPLPPSGGVAAPPAPAAVAAVAAEHPAAVSESSANATTGAPNVPQTETPGALPLVSPSAPTVVHPLLTPPEPTQQFRNFVDHLKINGVRTGPPARLFVEGATCRPGDVLDRDLGVVFDGVDATTSEILFKDATGAVVRRRF